MKSMKDHIGWRILHRVFVPVRTQINHQVQIKIQNQTCDQIRDQIRGQVWIRISNHNKDFYNVG